MSIRIVGYLVPDASMVNAQRSGWYTIWEAPPNLSAVVTLERAAARFRTWEKRLAKGSYEGTTRVALEVTGPNDSEGGEDGLIRVLDVGARS